MNFRASVMISSRSGSTKKDGISQFFDMECNTWISKIVDVYMLETFKNDNNTDEKRKDTARVLLEIVTPYKSIKDNVMYSEYNSAKEEMASIQDIARHLDKYYATLVHGAAVRVPLAEVCGFSLSLSLFTVVTLNKKCRCGVPTTRWSTQREIPSSFLTSCGSR